MTRRTTRIVGVAAVLVLLAVGTMGAPQPESEGSDADRAVKIQIKPLPEGVGRVFLRGTQDGPHKFELVHIDGTVERLSSEAFAERLYNSQTGKPWFHRLLNISSPVGFAWVLLGLLGQVFFTGRMLLQWFVSERAKRSFVPVGFWWMSLIGASMLLTYFIWRRDIVGVLGQAAGWMIYVRNLWLIYVPKR